MVAEKFNLRGKSALIAGDASFWGKYVAAALAEAGADVAIAGKDAKKMEDAINAAKRFGKKGIAIQTDVTKPAQVNEMVSKAITGLGKIDILVNANDVMFFKPFLETTEKEWKRVFELDLNPVFYCCQAVGKHMVERKYGRIINITSCFAERGIINGATYCTATAGIANLTRALALEWARSGITVNTVSAGYISETGKLDLPNEEKILHFLPLGRYGRPEEAGTLIVYLASEASEYFTGQIEHVDGALMMHA